MLTKKSLIIGAVFLISILVALSVYTWGTNAGYTKAHDSKTDLVVTQTVLIPNEKPTRFSIKTTQGSTALELLQKRMSVTTQGEGAQAFVTKIGSRAVDLKKREYWSFEVNGKEAQVGAGSYILQNKDSIVWILKNY